MLKKYFFQKSSNNLNATSSHVCESVAYVNVAVTMMAQGNPATDDGTDTANRAMLFPLAWLCLESQPQLFLGPQPFHSSTH